jgi:Beta-lactamase
VAIAWEHRLPSWTALKQRICAQSARDCQVLPQLSWLITRFRHADQRGWTVPGEQELQQHFAPEFLAALPAPELIATISGTPPWLVTKGWADVERGELLGPAHRWPAYCGSALVTATAVLRLVADGRVALDTPGQRPDPDHAPRGRHHYGPRAAHPHRRSGQSRPVRAARRPRARPVQRDRPGGGLRRPAWHGPAQQLPNLTASQVTTQQHVLLIAGIVSGLIVIAAWILIARATQAGKNWARITGAVLFGLATLDALSGLINPVAVPVKILAFVIWLLGLIAVIRLWRAASTAYFKAPRP